MKHLMGKTLSMAVAAAAILTATAFAGETGIVTGESVRLRADPSTDAPIVTYLNTSDQVEIIEDQDEWYKVEYNGAAGYLYAAYVSYGTNSSAPSGFSAESVTGKTGVITGSSVNFRSGPSTDSGIVTTLDDGFEVAITGAADDWCQIEWNGEEGYVKADYISVDGLPLVDPRGLITGDCVNVRSTPSTDGGIVMKVYGGNVVDLLSCDGDWYGVSYNGKTGYIRSDLLRVYTGAASSGLGADIVATAKQYLGTRYVYGGASSSGFDCSGFTMYVFSQFGYSLPHSATSQWNNSGTYVSREDLQAGDLVLFGDPSRSNGKACSHVGIYVGDGDFIHSSSSSSGGVIISSLYENYYSKYYVGAKRLG